MTEQKAAMYETKDDGQSHADPFSLACKILDDYYKLDPKQFESKMNLSCKNSKTTDTPMYIEHNKRGELTAVYLDDSIFSDTQLFRKTESPRGTPLNDAKLERLANVFALAEGISFPVRENGLIVSRSQVKHLAQYLLNESLLLEPAARYLVLSRAQEIDDKTDRAHSLNIVFSDLDGDQRREELAEFSVTFKQQHYNGQVSAERIDLYLQQGF